MLINNLLVCTLINYATRVTVADKKTTKAPILRRVFTSKKAENPAGTEKVSQPSTRTVKLGSSVDPQKKGHSSGARSKTTRSAVSICCQFFVSILLTSLLL